MKTIDIIPAWGRILRGHRPFLSVEITRECPLRCPGCYAFSKDHLGNGMHPRQLPELRGDDLVEGVMEMVRRHRPLHISIVGGEPMLRARELEQLLPRLEALGIEVQLVTSAVCLIPPDWKRFTNLHLVVSVDGLPAEHNARRAPATYEKILKNIAAHQVIVHCNITRHLLSRPGYLREFISYWSERPEARKIWCSLYTPQKGEDSAERLDDDDRKKIVEELGQLHREFPRLYASRIVLSGMLAPPDSPETCIFAQTTLCFAADLTTPIRPCQLGGKPECRECGCIASAGLAAIGKYKLAGLVSVGRIFSLSKRIGEMGNSRSLPASETAPESR